jgi:hypothetical protein
MKPRDKPLLVRRVDFIWYPLTLVPILALFLAAATGFVPAVFAPISLFLFFFWLSSLGFAIYAKIRKPREPRQ